MQIQIPDIFQLKDRIASTGLKVTQQRISILKALYELNDHPSAEILYGILSKEFPSLSLGTVYKTLDSLEEKGLIRKVFCSDGLKRFDVHTEPHSHLYCHTSNRIIDFDDPELNRMIMEYLQNKKINNFSIEDVQLQINGKIIEQNASVEIQS